MANMHDFPMLPYAREDLLCLSRPPVTQLTEDFDRLLSGDSAFEVVSRTEINILGWQVAFVRYAGSRSHFLFGHITDFGGPGEDLAFLAAFAIGGDVTPASPLAPAAYHSPRGE